MVVDKLSSFQRLSQIHPNPETFELDIKDLITLFNAFAALDNETIDLLFLLESRLWTSPKEQEDWWENLQDGIKSTIFQFGLLKRRTKKALSTEDFNEFVITINAIQKFLSRCLTIQDIKDQAILALQIFASKLREIRYVTDVARYKICFLHKKSVKS